MKYFLKSLTLLLLYTYAGHGYTPLWEVSYNYHLGKYFRYDANDPLILPQVMDMHEFSIFKSMSGNAPWQKYFRNPLIGLSIGYATYHRPEMGKSLMVMPYYEFVLLKLGPLQWVFKPSVGLSYSDNPYHEQNNRKNWTYSRAVNPTFFVETKLKLLAYKNIYCELGGAIRHISNGSVELPNVGINMLTASLGVRYTLNPGVRIIPTKDTTPVHRWKIRPYAEIARNHKSIYYGQNRAYLFYTLYLYAGIRLSKINSLLVGYDYMWDESFGDEYGRLNMTRPEKIDHHSHAITLGNELHLGPIGYATQIGYYLHIQEPFYGIWYHRHTFKYYLHDHVYLKSTLKVFGGAADMIDWGVGLRW